MPYTVTDTRTGARKVWPGPEPPSDAQLAALFSPSFAERAVNEYGVAETLGGLAGGALGTLLGPEATIPGAMLGAGAVRYVRGRLFRGETPLEAALPAVGTAGLEMIPYGGRLIRGVGRHMIASALPISKKIAKEVGGGLAQRGVPQLLQLAEDIPGIRLSKAAAYVGEAPTVGRAGAGRLGALAEARAAAVRQAEVAGRTVPVEPIVTGTETALLGPRGRLIATPNKPGAARTIRSFAQDLATERPMTPEELRAAVASGAAHAPGFTGTVKELLPLSPTRADEILRNMKFEPGTPHLAGTVTASRELRRGLSRGLKANVPRLAPILAEQQRLIPLQDVLDTALVTGRGLQPKAPAVYVSGDNPRLFGILRAGAPTTFGVGKAMTRVGGPLGANPWAQRTIAGSLRALAAQLLAQQDED